MDVIDNQGRDACAKKIRKALRRGPTGDLLQEKRQELGKAESTSLGKSINQRLTDNVVSALAKVGLLPARNEPGGVGQCSVNAIRKIHRKGTRVETPDQAYLRKLSSPPESWNSRNDSTTADTGGSQGTQRQSVPGAKPSRLGPAHADSISPRNALPTDDEDPTIKALKETFKRGPRRVL